jgi:hypothetical protein
MLKDVGRIEELGELDCPNHRVEEEGESGFRDRLAHYESRLSEKAEHKPQFAYIHHNS